MLSRKYSFKEMYFIQKENKLCTFKYNRRGRHFIFNVPEFEGRREI